MLKLIGDLHTHTLASTHAYSTILENANAAREEGLAYLAWTDHAPGMEDSPHPWHFHFTNFPERIGGVRILRGVEADIVDHAGGLDMDGEALAELDWVVASIHGCMYPAASPEENTAAYLGAAKNPFVDVIGHSGLERYPYDYDAAVKRIAELGKLVEINEATFSVRENSIENCKKIARACRRFECRVAVNSDAHFCRNIGHMERALKLLREVNFPERLIVNASRESMEEYLAERGRRVAAATAPRH